ncbi:MULTISPECIES: hypothetical protein [Proteiniclasticum]|uniref:hypothetical protein n=1 Tax=Proteiniclasticum TaxID=1155385 RepID=UPI00289F3365|nr:MULTISPECIES: hypothetical protein [Proteiniclasticum]
MKTISVREFVKLTGIKEGQVRDLTFAKGFPCVRIGRRVHIYEEKALEWLNKHEGKTVQIKRTLF